MLSALEGISYIEEDNLYAAKKSKDLGRDEFLQMFLAQLKYQDPLNPMEGTEFSTQLAQFSSLEQLFDVNDTLESIKTSQDGDNRYQVLDLIGKEIEAVGSSLSLEQGETARGGFYCEVPVECSILIMDQSGCPVRELNMGMLEAGEHSFEWDGRDYNGNLVEGGTYVYGVTAIAPSGDTVPVETHIRGVVDRINLNGDEPLLYIGSTAVQLSQIMNVNIPETETDSS